jgi:ribosomal protein S18
MKLLVRLTVNKVTTNEPCAEQIDFGLDFKILKNFVYILYNINKLKPSTLTGITFRLIK